MKRVFSLLLVASGVLLLGAAVFFVSIARTLPSPELLGGRRTAEATKIYDRTGKVLLYEIHGNERRTVVRFEDIPRSLKDATRAIEDIYFYKHPAFDWRSVVRALVANLERGGVAQGGSTITQQLAKNAFLTPERTVRRKIKELLLAIELERRFTKDQIFALYLNQIPYGSNVYGVEAASQTYFQKSVKGLSVAEAATLAAMTRAPSYYSPWGTHVNDLLARKDVVLQRMYETGLLTERELKEAQREKIRFAKPSVSIRAPHFVMAVQDYLNDKYGEDFVRTAGLTVTTALDWELQELAERAVSEGAKRNDELYQGKNAALVAEDATTGQILALVGSRNYFDTEHEGNFNVATQGLRQPGSAIKPFVYLTAFQKGYAPETVVFDVETEFDTTKDPEKSYKPHNFDEKFRGPVTLREALAQSLNVPSVKVLYLAGIDAALKNARGFGLTTLTEKSRYGLSLVLGGGEVKLIDVVQAYSVLAQEGVRHNQTLVLKVETGGRVLEQYEPAGGRVSDPQYPRLVNDILSDIDARSRLFVSSLPFTVFSGHDVALKTGTTEDFRDAWAVGYTPSLVVGVWAGNNDNAPMQRRGGSILAAVPIWNTFMAAALKNRVVETFRKPDPVFPGKPMLAGEYVVKYRLGETVLPQIHNVLFYVDRKNPLGDEPRNASPDPQFENWEKPVLAWGSTTIPNFWVDYNAPLPSGSIAAFSRAEEMLGPRLTMRIIRPENGFFVAQNYLAVDAEIYSSSEIDEVALYVNGVLTDFRKSASATTTLRYSFAKRMPSLELQNLIRLVATDKKGGVIRKEIIVFQQP